MHRIVEVGTNYLLDWGDGCTVPVEGADALSHRCKLPRLPRRKKKSKGLHGALGHTCKSAKSPPPKAAAATASACHPSNKLKTKRHKLHVIHLEHRAAKCWMRDAGRCCFIRLTPVWASSLKHFHKQQQPLAIQQRIRGLLGKSRAYQSKPVENIGKVKVVRSSNQAESPGTRSEQ